MNECECCRLEHPPHKSCYQCSYNKFCWYWRERKSKEVAPWECKYDRESLLSKKRWCLIDIKMIKRKYENSNRTWGKFRKFELDTATIAQRRINITMINITLKEANANQS